jgi:hypothetical protein
LSDSEVEVPDLGRYEEQHQKGPMDMRDIGLAGGPARDVLGPEVPSLHPDGGFA